MAHATEPTQASSAAPLPLHLPRPIRRALARIDRRLRAAAALRGLGTAGLAAALGAAAGMALDLSWPVPQAVRSAVWGAWLVAVGGLLVATIGRTLGRRGRQAIALAAVAERSAPGLGERLTGAVGLLAQGADRRRPAHGSPALIAALADDASARVGEVDPARAVPLGQARRRLTFGAFAVALVAVPAIVRPDPFGTLARRFLMPWASIDRVGRYVVTVAPGDTVAAIGDDLAVTAEVTPRFVAGSAPGSAWLEWTETADGRTRRLAMEENRAGADQNPNRPDSADSSQKRSPGPPGSRRFRVVLPRLAGSLTYRVVAGRSGEAESKRHAVTAVAPPGVAAIAVRVEPPAYTRFPARPARDPARVEAWEGSRVTVTVNATRAVRSVAVDWPHAKGSTEVESDRAVAKRVAATVGPDGLSATVTLPAEVSGGYSVALLDAHNIASRPEPPRRLTVRLDGPPMLAIRGVEGLDEARADDILRVGVVATDDIAVASVELHYSVDRVGAKGTPSSGPGSGKVAAKLAGLGTSRAEGAVALGLKALELKPGDAVSYRVRVADNRPAPRGPNVVWSGPRRLGIVAAAAPLWARRSQADREAVQAKLDALKKAAAENRHETEQLRYAADAAARGNGAWNRERSQSLADREAAARDVADRLQAFAHDLDDDSAFNPLARPARQVAEVEAEAARATLDQARQASDSSKRLADLRQADARLGAVSTRLEELQRQLDALAKRELDRQKLQALADRQEQVAERAESQAVAANDPHAPARLDKLDSEQNAVRKDLDALLRDNPELKAGVLAEEAADADALAKRARVVADRQREEARRGTDLTAKAGALHALAEEQRALENEARLLAVDVDQALAETGRGRLNTEPIHQASEPIERADLALGGQRLVEAENELRRFARDLDDAPGDLKARARRLAQAQDRIARDAAQALGDARSKRSVPDDERAELADRLKPLAARQKAVSDVAAALLETTEAKDEKAQPRFPLDAARDAAAAAARAGETLRKADNPHDVERHAQESHKNLDRLANELPDPSRRAEPSRRAFNESRQTLREALDEVERDLRETEPLTAKDPARAAADLAQRVAHSADRARRAAEQLDAPDAAFHPRLIPQRDRASARARALAEAVARVRSQAQKEPPARFDPGRARALRDALHAAALDARAGFERLEQKLNGQVPADDLAEELADEQNALARATQAAANTRAKANATAKDKPRAADGPEVASLGNDQRRLASALRGLQHSAADAPLELEEAILQSERAALLLEAGKAAAEAVGRAAAAVEALARRLNDRQSPRARVEALARAERKLNGPEARDAVASDPAGAVRRQQVIAAELARLIGPTDKSAKPAAGEAPARDKAEEAVRVAAELAGRAAKPPDPGAAAEARPTVADLARARARAADALEALAAKLPDAVARSNDKRTGRDTNKPRTDTPRDVELAITPEHAARAADLARRERRLRERLHAMLAERADPQRDLRRESAELGRDLTDLRDRTRDLSPRAIGPANEAAAMLGEHAPRAMDEAANRLAQGQPTPARDAQRRAAELAERGAQNAEDLADALRADANTKTRQARAQDAADPESKHRADPEANPLAAAREAMNAAARSLQQARDPDARPQADAKADSNPLQAARKSMRGAAERLQAAAEARGQGQKQSKKSNGSDPAQAEAQAESEGPPTGTESEATRDREGRRAGVAAAAELREVQELVRKKTGRVWGELPGHLRTEILQMSQGRYRDDYARLIQLYFREIAAGADANTNTSTRPSPGQTTKDARP